MVALPLGKLALLAVKQVAKPISKALKNGAMSSKFFKNYVVMPPAQAINWVDVKVKTTLMGAKGGKVYRLNERVAVEYGAELLSEFFIYGLGTVIMVYEYTRSLAKDEKKEQQLADSRKETKSDIERLKSDLIDVSFTVEHQSAEIRSLERQLHHMHSIVAELSDKS